MPQTNSNSIIEFIKVTKIYPPDVVALKDISFNVRQGEMIFLTGMSGAGKTTLLKLICSLEHPSKGLIEIMGKDLGKMKPRDLQKLRQQTGVAYQDFKLLPRHTVYQNIAMPMEVTYKQPKQIKERIDFLLDALNLSRKKEIKTDRLSRGEQQRVAIARAAANSPPLLLADEPTGNLDPTNKALVVNLFTALNQAGTTMIIATHDRSIYQGKNHTIIDIDQGEITVHNNPAS
jgi:cell division transport system ATP-binding protein